MTIVVRALMMSAKIALSATDIIPSMLVVELRNFISETASINHTWNDNQQTSSESKLLNTGLILLKIDVGITMRLMMMMRIVLMLKAYLQHAIGQFCFVQLLIVIDQANLIALMIF